MRFPLKTLAFLVPISLALSGCVSQGPEVAEPERYEDRVGVQLFMWNWDSIAAECEFLSDSGIDWVLTSPPQEHITGAAWWTVYQPVSYKIESRLGTRQQFENMVSTCASHGVDIIADAVINHMSAQTSGVGYAGTEYTKYEYPGLYSRDDFHNCNLTPNDQIQNYKDLAQVQTCELLGLSDLDQKNPNVQERILAYFNDLLSLGVKGFRIDAAKHIYAPDLKAIIDQLPEGTRIIHEVIRGGGEPVQPEQYLSSGEVWEFDYARAMKSYVKGEVITPAGSAIRFRDFTPSNQSLSFISNHDTERNGETINYKDLRDFELATAMMLAEDYGQPILYSSYAFSSFDAGPYETVQGVRDASCEVNQAGFVAPKSDYKPNDWICQHRFESTVNMIKFRKAVSGTELTEKYRERGVYGFARAGKGYFIVNVFKSQPLEIEVQTLLPDGEYQNLIDGNRYQIVDGVLKTTLKPKTAIALLND
jgi:alpha-amylase